jgi:predicted nucleic acid-binding protein
VANPKTFVLDASVTIRWAMQDGSVNDRNYAESVLESLDFSVALVPALWYTEVVHVLRGAETRKLIGESVSTEFISRLHQLPILNDERPLHESQLSVASLSREFNLSGYDAQYLELAVWHGIPIASLDKGLIKAAKKKSLSLYLGA